MTTKKDTKDRIIKASNRSIAICKLINENTENLKAKIGLTELDKTLKEMKLGFVEIVEPQLLFQAKLYENWQKYLKNKDADIFSLEDICNLSFIFEIFDNEEYWKLLNTIKNIDKVIFYLIRNFHYYWTDLSDFETKIIYLKNILNKLNSVKEIINIWKENPINIFGTNEKRLEKILAEAIKHKYGNIDIIYNDSKYNIKNEDLISKLIQYECLIYYIKNLKKENFNEIFKNIKVFHNNIKNPKFRTSDTRKASKTLSNTGYKLISEFIIKCNEIPLNRVEIMDYFVSELGDPRLSIKDWTFIDNHAVNIFKSWLNEKDIRFFFDKLIDDRTDSQDRKGFWIEYSKQVEDAIFLIGNDVAINKENNEDIKNFKQNTDKHKFMLIRCKSNIFLLKIKNHWFVEFSEYGNACFAYPNDIYENNIKCQFNTNYARNHFKISNLKINNGNQQIQRFAHRNSYNKDIHWQNKIRRFIDTL